MVYHTFQTIPPQQHGLPVHQLTSPESSAVLGYLEGYAERNETPFCLVVHQFHNSFYTFQTIWTDNAHNDHYGFLTPGTNGFPLCLQVV